MNDLARLGADDGRIELVDGTYVLKPWPTPLQSRVTRRLVKLLTKAAAPGLKVMPRTPVEISHRSLLVPDIVVAAAAPPDDPSLADPPSLVVEVADASKRRFDRMKLDVYRERGIPSCWLVEPDIPGIDAYDLVEGNYVLSAAARNDQPLEVVRPFPVTIVPACLVDPPDPD